MAKNTPAVLEEDTVEEVTVKQVIAEGIDRVLAETGIDVQKNRYKAMRAIAFQAFAEAVENDEFDALVDRALANIDDLPSGWKIEKEASEATVTKTAKKKPAAKATEDAPAPKKAPAKAAPAKASAKAAAPAARKRPTR